MTAVDAGRADGVTAPAEARRSVVDRVYGAIGVVAVLAALGFLLFGSGEDGGGASGAAPALALVSPAAGEVVAQPVAVVFRAPGDLRPGPMGWTDGERHLHLAVDGTELMAGPGDVVRLPDGRYRWTLPSLPAGERTLRLSWSDARHRPLEAGASEPVTVRVE